MNENLDLRKILEGCPKGTKFYNSIYGEVRFERIVENVAYPIVLSICNNDSCNAINVTKKGLHYKDFNGECVLFPSKDQRDWSKFERFWDKPKVQRFDPHTLHPFDKILARDGSHHIWTCALLSHIDDLNYAYKVITDGTCYTWCIPYNDETKNLVGTTDDCPEFYKWWEEEICQR